MRPRLADLSGRRGPALVLVGTLDEAVTGFALCHRRRTGAATAVAGCSTPATSSRRPGGWGWAGSCWSRAGLAGGAGLPRGGRHRPPGDREAKNFFESAGFKARMLTMHRELG